MSSLADIRKEYAKAKLDTHSLPGDPMVQFEKWFSEALDAKVPEPNAMNLATVSGNGLPSSRIVLLKGIENGKFVFYSNYQSNKGKDLDENPACALVFFWPELERQVRVNGVTLRVSEERSTKYFQSRPRPSQIGAWASPQSLVISDRSILDQRALEMEKKFAGLTVLPKPKQWGGYEVEAHQIEFWQGRPSRLHDRIIYSLIDGAWKIQRLAP